MNDVCATMFEQIRMAELRVMLNARNVYYDNRKNEIGFRFSGNRKVNHFRMRYDAGADLYNVILGHMGRTEYREVRTAEGLFAEDVIPFLQRETGLECRVPRMRLARV